MNAEETSPTTAPPPAPRVVAVIPTYNNARTVGAVVRQVREHLPDVIVVVDGSVDDTTAVLAEIPGIDMVRLPRNTGKGNALRTGFDRAVERGFSHAVTIDADGQHLAADVPLFLAKINEAPDTLWIGNRVIPCGGTPQPARSKYGGMWGAMWYRFHTGLAIRDTQCGFRAYPLSSIIALGSRAQRYDWEQDVLIKAAWSGIPVKQADIHLVYLPPGERVSHFRPLRDFSSLFVINTRAALIRIFMPWRFIDAPGRNVREKLRHLVMKEIKGGYGARTSAVSLSVGVLFGLLPIHGFQVVSVLAASVMFRMSKLLAMLGVSVSSAPFLPFWIALGVGIGKVILPDRVLIALLRPMASWIGTGTTASAVAVNGLQWFFGSIVMAAACALLTLAITYPLFLGLEKVRSRIKGS